MSDSIQITGKVTKEYAEILTPDAITFLAELHENFNQRRLDLLEARQVLQKKIDESGTLDLLEETREIREGDWQVAPSPPDLVERKCEITGPVDRKMMINALNSGACVFMADFEDANSPTWPNCVEGQINCRDAVRRELSFYDEKREKHYELEAEESLATLVIRPRGWHLPEKHILFHGKPSSGSLMDFGLYFFHNVKEAMRRGTGIYCYLPKMESYLEARLWNDVFTYSQKALGIPHGSIRATVLIETIPAAFQMEEILYELKDHSAGLNAGRWDYIFSCVKRFRKAAPPFPDREQILMTVPFLHAYTERIVRACHKRGAHAIGGMAAAVPSRHDPSATERSIQQAHVDKAREVKQGFDGSWVAHPELISVCLEEFNKVLGERPHQKENKREDVDSSVTPEQLIEFGIEGGTMSEAGLRFNVSVALQYINAWFLGYGATAINNRMEDVATAEISRTQIWQWIQKGIALDNGTKVTRDLYTKIADEEGAKLSPETYTYLKEARSILDRVVLADDFPEFLSLYSYEMLES